MSSVAALFIDPLGPYPGLLGTDACWDAARDARTYDGSDPVKRIEPVPANEDGEVREPGSDG